MDRTSDESLVRALYVALAEGDRHRLQSLLHPAFVGRVTRSMPLDLGGTYASPTSMQDDFWFRLGAVWCATAEPRTLDRLIDGRLLVRGEYIGTVRRTGAALRAEYTHLVTVTDGRIAALDQLTDSAAWARSLEPETVTTIDYRVEGPLARMVIDRSEHRNAIDLALARDTLAVARQIATDDRVRAVLIEARGRDFTVGGDLAHIAGSTEDMGQHLRSMVTPFHEGLALLSRLDVPVVTAARGAVAGGGIGLVYAADVSLVSTTARLVTGFADLGLSGDGGGSWHLPRRVGVARAADIMMRNRPLLAEEAGRIGLVSEVIPDEQLDEVALATARSLAAGPTRGLAAMRRLLRGTWHRSLEEQLQAETEELAATGRTADAARAVRAFVARDTPTFEGR